MPPRVVSAFAALCCIARGCRDDSVRAPVAEAIPTRMCGGKGNRVRGQSPAETAVAAKTITILRNIRSTPFAMQSLA